MSLKTVIASILHPTTGTAIGRIELSLVQHAVAIAKADTGLVGKIETQIAAVAHATNADGSAMTGAQKRAAVVEAVGADVLAFVADPTKAVADIVDFAHELVQAVYDDAVSASAGAVAAIIVARAG